MAVLRRPPDGVPHWHAGGSAWHHPAAESRQALCRRLSGRIFQAARLGPASHAAAGAAVRRRAGRSGGAACHHAVPLRRLHRQRRDDDPAGADRLQRRAGRVDSGQGAGARVLRAPEHQDAGQSRHLYPRRHPTDEPRLYPPAGPRRPRAGDRPGRLPQPGWTAYFLRVSLAVALMAAMLFYAMGDTQWWLAARSYERLARMALLVGGGIALYFAALGLMGFRPRQFARRAAE